MRGAAGGSGAKAPRVVLALLLAGPAQAADPWGRPGHLRAVQQPPAAWEDIGADRLPVRLWWDEACPWASATTLDLTACRVAEVQELRRRWRTVATDARPGWTSRPVLPGTRFRVRVDGATRWSGVVSAPEVVTPSDLSALAGPGVLAAEVGQLAVGSRDQVFGSTLGGGLLLAGPGGVEQRWTRWEGLPDDRVLAVDARGDAVLAGTGRGAALLQDGRVVAVVDALPSAYVQATHVDAGNLWLGTDAGLARVRGGRIEVLSDDASVFSVSPAHRGGVWIGAGGLVHLAEDGTRGDTMLFGQHVYDVLDHGAPTWIASEQGGLFALDGDSIAPSRDLAEAYAIAPGPGGPWVAAGAGGVSGPSGTLDVGTAWSVATTGGRLWIGTDHGLLWRDADGAAGALPLTPLPAEAAVLGLSTCVGGADLRLRDGQVTLGAGCPAPEAAGARWEVDGGMVFEVRDGQRRPHVTDHAPRAVAAGASGVCIGTITGVERLEGELLDLGEAVTAVASAPGGCWYATASGTVGRTSGSSLPLPTSAEPAIQQLVADPRDADAVWALSDRGAWRVTLP